MARYPTLEDYHARRNYSDGVKRCDDLLRKSPNDIQLLTTKFKLLATQSSQQADSTHKDDSTAVLETLATLPNPIQDLTDLCQIEMAAVEAAQTTHPPLLTAGPQISKLWDAAVKATPSLTRKLDIMSTRWERAVFDDRLADMQLALIQLKALQPRNRVVYLAHAAVTQMLSSTEGDLQGRLAVGLARKAMGPGFEGAGDAGLDWRVPGQIFAVQGLVEEVTGVSRGKGGESRQVWEFLRGLERREGKEGKAVDAVVLDPAAVPAKEWLVAEIARLKQEFAGLIAAQASVDTIRAFAMNAIRLFHSATTTLSTNARRSPADACFLAISATVRLFEQTTSLNYLLHTAYLAEHLLTTHPDIHEARLILVYIYMRLNLASLAITYFDSLNVKEIQHDTISHVLFTRLSLLHPHPTLLKAKKETYDPLRQLRRGLDVYVRCEAKLAETEASVLHHGQTGMLLDLHELRENLRFSLARRIAVLEWRRAGRLMRNKCEDHDSLSSMGPHVVRNWTESKDNRDFNAAFDYGYRVETMLHGTGVALPGKAWVAFALAADTAWCLATDQPPAVVDLGDAWTLAIREATTSTKSTDGTPATAANLGLTPPELLAGTLAQRVLTLLLLARQPHNATSTNNSDSSSSSSEPANKPSHHLASALQAVSTALTDLNIPSLTSTQEPLATHLPDHYLYADALRTVLAACTALTKKDPTTTAAAAVTPSLSPDIEALRKHAREGFAALQRHAVEQVAGIKGKGVRELMMREDEGLWEAVLELDQSSSSSGGGGVDGFCEVVGEAAREGWEGVGRIRVV